MVIVFCNVIVFHNLYYMNSTEYIDKYATEEALREKEQQDSSSDESEMSDLSEDETQDMEI